LITPLSRSVQNGAVDRRQEERILRGCRSGKRQAFKELYDCYSPMLYNVALRLLGSRDDAEDALHNCFIRLYRYIGKFEGRSSLRSYITRILIHCCYDIAAKRKENSGDALPEVPSLPAERPLWELEKALTQLPEKMRECFVLFALEGFAQPEIADMLEISVGTVKAHIHQARARLKDLLELQE